MARQPIHCARSAASPTKLPHSFLSPTSQKVTIPRVSSRKSRGFERRNEVSNVAPRKPAIDQSGRSGPLLPWTCSFSPSLPPAELSGPSTSPEFAGLQYGSWGRLVREWPLADLDH